MERIFEEHMSELYWLAYLLTGDRERSVQAFTGALNSDAKTPALQRFMLSWARRLVIVEALGTIRRQLRESVSRTRPSNRHEPEGLSGLPSADLTHLTKRELEAVLLALDVFSRCAVILTILEGLPVKEVAELLGTDEATVKTAQAQGVTELTWRMADAAVPVSALDFRLGRQAIVAFG